MNQKLLTIVIAAYNKENLLRRCLDTLIDERVMDDVEVLVVNDGSKDYTLNIALEYEQRFPHYFHAIDKENGNYGSVMNLGLVLAKGKFFRTLDADDWYNTEAYVQFVLDLKASDADLIICDGITHYEQDGHEEEMHIDDEFEKNKDLVVNPKMWQNKTIKAWTKVQTMVFKTQIIRESGLRWLEGVFYTDTQYCYWPLRLVRTVRIVPYPVYVYLVGIDEQSMSPENVKKNYSHFLAVANVMVDDFSVQYNPCCPTIRLQEKFVNQILGCVYSVLLSGDTDYLDKIVTLHRKICNIPNYQTLLEKHFTKFGICYIKGIETGKISRPRLTLYNYILIIRDSLRSIKRKISAL